MFLTLKSSPNYLDQTGNGNLCVHIDCFELFGLMPMFNDCLFKLINLSNMPVKRFPPLRRARGPHLDKASH